MNFNKPKFWNNQFSLLSFVLYPFSLIYTLLFNLKRILSKKISFSKPVICIGNIYLGGSGKTPLAITISKMHQDMYYMNNLNIYIKTYLFQPLLFS